VTDQALSLIAENPRLTRRIGLDGIENSPLLLVSGRQFDNVTTLYPTNISIVVEIQGSRPPWTDFMKLEAGFGENQRLGCDWNL
jgi:hypothetical protein